MNKNTIAAKRILARVAQKPAMMCASLGALVGVANMPVDAHAEEAQADTITGAIQNGSLIFSARPRYEHAEQDGVASADAFTMRTRLGWETAEWNGLTGLLEFEDVRQLGGNHYNDGVAPAEPYVSISDPEVTEINRAQLTWQIADGFSTTLGRQLITLDDQRFVGISNWRQDAKSSDAARFDFSRGAFAATYVYLDSYNRHLAETADWDSNSHLINASYAFSDAFKLVGFAYLLDFDGSAASQSTDIYGVRVSGKADAGPLGLSYAAYYATEEDAGDNPTSFELDYWSAWVAASHGPFWARLSYDSFEGDGARGFITPISANHNTQGWSDVFNTKPTDGLEDFNVMGTYSPDFSLPFLSDIKFTARWHDFEAERTGADFGEEADFSVEGDITEHLTALIKFADYQSGDAGSPLDTQRTWLQFEYKL